MKKVLVLNGPNLNLLGRREPEIYGTQSLSDINLKMKEYGDQIGFELHFIQTNHEGELIDSLHDAMDWSDGVLFNPGAYTHTSVAIRDAISGIGLPVIEVHLSNIYAREPFRHISYISPVCKGTIMGFGWLSYKLALIALSELL